MADVRQPRAWWAPFLSRKFLMSAAVLATATWLRWLNLIDATDWKQLAVAVLAIYGASNVAQKKIDKEAPAPDTPAP